MHHSFTFSRAHTCIILSPSLSPHPLARVTHNAAEDGSCLLPRISIARAAALRALIRRVFVSEAKASLYAVDEIFGIVDLFREDVAGNVQFWMQNLIVDLVYRFKFVFSYLIDTRITATLSFCHDRAQEIQL